MAKVVFRDNSPILDRVEHFDDRSRNYAISDLLAPAPVERRQQIWTPRASPLDQGREGACVGFAFSGELAALPWKYEVDNAFAITLYQQAREQDRAMGNNWAAGASLLAGAKACQSRGLIGEYRWAFGVDDVINTLISHGPVILGIPWLSDMYETSQYGLVKVSGQQVGGHAIMANGYLPAHPTLGGEVVMWTNSWGADYGLNGVGYIRPQNLALLLSRGGEACVPTDRPIPGQS
jgi:hypothetical protein